MKKGINTYFLLIAYLAILFFHCNHPQVPIDPSYSNNLPEIQDSTRFSKFHWIEGKPHLNQSDLLDSLLATPLTKTDSFYLLIKKVVVPYQTDQQNVDEIFSNLQKSLPDGCNELSVIFHQNFGGYLSSQDRIQEAEKEVLQALKCAHKLYHSKHYLLLKLTEQLADIYLFKLDEYTKSDSLYHAILLDISAFRNIDTLFIGNIYYKLGASKRQLAEYDISRHFLQEAKKIAKRYSDSLLLASIYNEEAIVVGNQYEHQNAALFADSAFLFANQVNNDEQIRKAMMIKALSYSITKDYESSHLLNLENLKKTSTILDRKELLIRTAENLLRWEKVDSAKKYLTKAASVQILAPKLKHAFFEFVFAKYYAFLGQFSPAIAHINQSIKLAHPYSDAGFDLNDHGLPTINPGRIHEWLIYYLGHKAGMLFAHYKSSLNQELLEESLTHYRYIDSLVVESYRFTDDADEYHSMSILHEVYFNAIRTLFQMYELSQKPEYLETAHIFSERIRSRRLYRHLTYTKVLKNAPDTLQELLILEDSITNILTQSRLDKNFTAFEENSLNLTRDSLQILMKSRYPFVYNMYHQKLIPSLEKIRTWCEDHKTLIISFISGLENDLIILAYQQDTFKYKYIPEELHVLDSIRHYKDSLFYKTTSENYELNKLSYYLYSQLLKDFTANHEFTDLILLPDGILEQIPIHGLVTDTLENQKGSLEGKYLFNYSNVFSAYTLSNLSNWDPSEWNNLFKTPILSFVNAKSKKDYDLPKTFLEGKLIKKTFGKEAKVLFGDQATFQNYTNYSNDYLSLHLALHGVASIYDLGKTGIHFKDAFVNVYELQNSTNRFEFVFLNICRSDAGKYFAGEGIESVAKAFAMTGCKIVISSFIDLNDNLAYEFAKDLLNSGSFMNLKNKNLALNYKINIL